MNGKELVKKLATWENLADVFIRDIKKSKESGDNGMDG